MNLWRHIQSKSSEMKAQYAFVGASVLTSAIALVWISTVPARFSDATVQGDSLENEPGELRELFDEAKNQLGNVLGSSEKEETSLDILGNTQGEEGTLDAGPQDFFIDSLPEEKPNVPAPEEVVDKEPVATPPIKETPRTILIGTSTSKKLE